MFHKGLLVLLLLGSTVILNSEALRKKKTKTKWVCKNVEVEDDSGDEDMEESETGTGGTSVDRKPPPQPAPAVESKGDFQEECLEAHNAIREMLRLAPMETNHAAMRFMRLRAKQIAKEFQPGGLQPGTAENIAYVNRDVDCDYVVNKLWFKDGYGGKAYIENPTNRQLSCAKFIARGESYVSCRYF